MPNVREQLSEYQSVLDHLAELTKLSKVPLNDDVDEILGMRYATLSKLSAEQCGEYAFILAQYAAHIQVAQNEARAKQNWAHSELVEQSAGVLDSYGDNYVRMEVKIAKAIKEHENLKLLNDIERKATSIITQLDFIASRINMMAQTLLELQQTKRKFR